MIHDMTLPMSPEAEARWAGILEWAEKELEALEPGEARRIMDGVVGIPADSGRTADFRGTRRRWYDWRKRVDLCG